MAIKKYFSLKNWIKFIKLSFWGTIQIVEHNPQHYTKIKILNQEIKACSRCLGTYIAGLIFFPLFGAIYVFTDLQLPFWAVFITSYILASLTIVDWMTVHTFHLREGNERTRILCGFFLGLGGMLYFWLLPTDWWFRLGTLFLYMVIALLLAYFGERREKKNGATQVNTSA